MLNKKFQELTKELEQKKRTKNMLEGELSGLEKEIKVLKIDTIEQAEEELSKLKQNQERIAKKISDKLDEFESKFKDDLDA